MTAESAPSLQTIFDACDADNSQRLDQDEIGFALESVGLYPTKEVFERIARSLELSLPLDLAGFEELVLHMTKTDADVVPRGLEVVPYSRRGLSLRQIRAVATGTLDSGWLQSVCDAFNAANQADIEAGTKFAMKTNLYAYNTEFVQPLTDSDAAARAHIPAEVLEAARVPGVPQHKCCFSQLLNPDGVEVDVFISHYWAHDFARTVQALCHYAEAVYKGLGKESPEDVVFWICLFALNQHQAEKEVGRSPELGPFNAALAKARYGAAMVLDASAEPFKRVWWCVATDSS